jgi:hypothetical protein
MPTDQITASELAAALGKKNKAVEREIQTAVVDFLRAKGWRPVRTHPVAMAGFSAGEPGQADFLFLHYVCGVMLWVEFKAPGKNPTPKQAAWIERERARGAVVWVVWDVGAFIERYTALYGYLHDGGPRSVGQVEMAL